MQYLDSIQVNFSSIKPAISRNLTAIQFICTCKGKERGLELIMVLICHVSGVGGGGETPNTGLDIYCNFVNLLVNIIECRCNFLLYIKHNYGEKTYLMCTSKAVQNSQRQVVQKNKFVWNFQTFLLLYLPN